MTEVARYGRTTAHEGKAEELAERLLAAASELGDDPGCLLYLVNRQRDRPEVIWVTELWRSKGDLDASVERIQAEQVDAVKGLAAEWEMVELDLLGGKGPISGPGDAAAAGRPPYTVKKLTDAEDSAAKYGFSEMGESRFANEDLETEQTGLSHHRLRPDTRQMFAHRHKRAEEVYLVLSGSGRVKLDDEILELERLDAVRVAPGVIRAFEGGPDGMELIAFGPRREGDAETVPGWWSD